MTPRIFAALVLFFWAAGGAPRQGTATTRELVVCGWNEVFILDLDATTGGAPRRIWTWRARERTDLPDDFKTLFNATDECKPFEGGRTILITSSGGGVALVDRVEDRVLFHARAANAHSAELLPRGRIAVAASHDQAGKGDRLIVFDVTRSNQELWSGDLPWGHGVVWDEQRRVLWALADKDIRAFELRDWDSAAPRLQRVALIALPEAGGHDLSPVGNTAMLAVSTGNRCWLFDRDARTFAPHPDLGDKQRVKGISHHPATGQLAYVQAEGKDWWAERIHFLHPSATLHLPGEHFYKVRWNTAAK
jgi:hypothetical protein